MRSLLLVAGLFVAGCGGAAAVSHPVVHAAPVTRCADVRVVVDPAGNASLSVSGCGETPRWAPTADELARMLAPFTARHKS